MCKQVEVALQTHRDIPDVNDTRSLVDISTSKPGDDFLDTQFGPAIHAPSASKLEQELAPASLCKLDSESAEQLKNYLSFAINGFPITSVIHERLPLLWAIDEIGDFWFATEEVVDPKELTYQYSLPRGIRMQDGHTKLGHPSLLGGKRARIAGEIWFQRGTYKNRWVITNKSGRFGGGPDRIERHLENVVALLSGHGIVVESIFIGPAQ